MSTLMAMSITYVVSPVTLLLAFTSRFPFTMAGRRRTMRRSVVARLISLRSPNNIGSSDVGMFGSMRWSSPTPKTPSITICR